MSLVKVKGTLCTLQYDKSSSLHFLEFWPYDKNVSTEYLSLICDLKIEWVAFATINSHCFGTNVFLESASLLHSRKYDLDQTTVK